MVVVDRNLHLMGDKTIPESAVPRLESFHPPFVVTGIDLLHQNVVHSYNSIFTSTHRWKYVSKKWDKNVSVLLSELIVKKW